MADADLDALAKDELARALTLSWRQLAKVLPWGDSFDGLTPAGREVIVERAYIWQDEAGGDILVEVEVYGGPSRREYGALRTALIPREEAA